MVRPLSMLALLGLAAVIALVTGHLVHNDLGVPSATIRDDAFVAAGFLSFVCALNFIKKRD